MDYYTLRDRTIAQTRKSLSEYYDDFFNKNSDLGGIANRYTKLRKDFIDGENLKGDFEGLYFHYYVMRYVSIDYRKRYFSKMVELQNGACCSIEELTTTLKDGDKIMLSFATKLLNISDGVSPLYDNNVCTLMKLSYEKFSGEKESQYLDCYKVIKDVYAEILPENLDKINAFKNHFELDNPELLSSTKIMDFILWRMGRDVIEKTNRLKQNKRATTFITR